MVSHAESCSFDCGSGSRGFAGGVDAAGSWAVRANGQCPAVAVGAFVAEPVFLLRAVAEPPAAGSSLRRKESGAGRAGGSPRGLQVVQRGGAFGIGEAI